MSFDQHGKNPQFPIQHFSSTELVSPYDLGWIELPRVYETF